VREVLPVIRQSIPDVNLRIIGRRPAPEVLALTKQDAAVEVTGTVDDVRPWLADCAAMVVPLLSGGGTRIKILEAMAQGVPVISTTVGAEGLPFENGKHLLLADDPASFAAACVSLINTAAKRENLTKAARDEVVARYSWAAAAAKFCALCEPVVRR
jgi:glycosyltransferase involved in cell wall biosynthesis